MNIDKIKHFAQDKNMCASVKEYIIEEATRPAEKKDVHVLAAERIAIDIIKSAFVSIENLRKSEATEQRVANPGL